MGFLDILKPRKKGDTIPEGEAPDEYIIPELVPLDLSPMKDILAERREQERLMKKYGIERATAGSI